MRDKVIINVASYGRVDSLIKTLESIINQCDVINVALNDHYDKEIPLFLYNPKINIFFTDNSFGDAFKFMDLTKSENAYFFTIDDDLIYPSNYVEYMISKSKEYNDSKVITLHGRNFSKFPISSYYRSASDRYSCLGTVNKDVKVQFGGTGVMCFHTNLMKIPLDYFKMPNMADVWVGKYCIENNIDIICVKHDTGFIKYTPQKETIYDNHSRKDTTQTMIVNSIYDKNLNLNFNNTNVQVEPEKFIEEQIVRLPIKPTIEKNAKKIDYDKVNSIFNKFADPKPSVKNIINQPTNPKTNSDVLRKLMSKRRGK